MHVMLFPEIFLGCARIRISSPFSMINIGNTVDSEIFRENFIFMNNVKRHVCCNVKNLQLEHDLSTSVIGRVISPFCKGFIFAKLSQKIKPLRKFLNLQYSKNSRKDPILKKQKRDIGS